MYREKSLFHNMLFCFVFLLETVFLYCSFHTVKQVEIVNETVVSVCEAFLNSRGRCCAVDFTQISQA